MLAKEGIRAVGTDPTPALLRRVEALDPAREYRLGEAKHLDVASGRFDLVVSHLTLIDIADHRAAIAAMASALAPGGTLLVANLTSFPTAGMPEGWTTLDGEPRFCIDRHLERRALRAEWRGIKVRNWHRPLSAYMSAFLDSGLILRYFDEPAPMGGDPVRAERYPSRPVFPHHGVGEAVLIRVICRLAP